MARVNAPRGLKAAGRRLWNATTDTYEMREDELVILKDACAEADLIARMEKELETEDLTVKGSMGQLVAHPLVQELRQHRSTLAALLRGLKLPDDGAEQGGSNQQREAAQSRWAQAHGASA